MKHEIKNLSPDVPMGGEGSFVIDNIQYFEIDNPNKAGEKALLVSCVNSNAIKKEGNEDVLRIPETVIYHCKRYEVIGICGSAIGGNISILYLPHTLRIFSGYSFCNCKVDVIKMLNDKESEYFSILNRSLIFDKSGNRLIYASTNIPIGLGEWRGTKIIGEYAFCNFKGKEITIPYSVEYVERMAFADAKNLRTVYFEEHIPCGVNISTFNLVYENICIKLIRKP